MMMTVAYLLHLNRTACYFRFSFFSFSHLNVMLPSFISPHNVNLEDRILGKLSRLLHPETVSLSIDCRSWTRKNGRMQTLFLFFPNIKQKIISLRFNLVFISLSPAEGFLFFLLYEGYPKTFPPPRMWSHCWRLTETFAALRSSSPPGCPFWLPVTWRCFCPAPSTWTPNSGRS